MSTIHIVFGPQCAGKSTYSKQLSQEKKAVRFSIDEWMWNLYGKDLPKSMSLRWIMERVGRCEQQIWDTAKQMASLGTDIILDLGFTKFEKREQFVALAKEQGFSVQIHYVQAPLQLRKQRVMDRNKKKGDTFSFEVSPGMFDFMEGEFQVPREKEWKEAIVVDTAEA